MNLSNSAYDKLKLLVQVILPGLATLYVGLSALWEDLFRPTAVAGTITLVATFLGLFLVKSSSDYSGAGDLVVTTDQSDGSVFLSADLNEDPVTFANKKNVVLNIRRQDVPI